MAGWSGRAQLVLLLLVTGLHDQGLVASSLGQDGGDAPSTLWLSKLGSVGFEPTDAAALGPLAPNATATADAPNDPETGEEAAWLVAFVEWYDAMVHRYPFPTKSLTSATIGFVGDAMAQGIEQWLSNAQPYDTRRALSVAVSEGIAGPGLHCCYGLVEWSFPTVGLVGLLARLSTASVHWAFDTFLFDAIFIVNAFVCTGVLEGKRLVQDIVPQVALEFLPTMRASVFTGVCLSPLELCVFTFVPPAYRVLAINCNDVVWNAIVSFFAHRERRRQTQREKEATRKKKH